MIAVLSSGWEDILVYKLKSGLKQAIWSWDGDRACTQYTWAHWVVLIGSYSCAWFSSKFVMAILLLNLSKWLWTSICEVLGVHDVIRSSALAVLKMTINMMIRSPSDVLDVDLVLFNWISSSFSCTYEPFCMGGPPWQDDYTVTPSLTGGTSFG